MIFVLKLTEDTGNPVMSACETELSGCSNLKMSSEVNASKITDIFAQVKAVNTSENLLNEIRQIIYSLYQAK